MTSLGGTTLFPSASAVPSGIYGGSTVIVMSGDYAGCVASNANVMQTCCEQQGIDILAVNNTMGCPSYDINHAPTGLVWKTFKDCVGQFAMDGSLLSSASASATGSASASSSSADFFPGGGLFNQAASSCDSLTSGGIQLNRHTLLSALTAGTIFILSVSAL